MSEQETLLRAASVAGDAIDFPYRDRQGNAPSYTYKVPANLHYLYIVGCGGSGRHATGADSGGPGGGGIIQALVPVVPGETLSIFVGDGAGEGWQGRSGYRPGGDGGKAPRAHPANGGGGGGSTAVVDATGRVLIHAAGGGGCGGRGELDGIQGGTGGTGGLNPENGTPGQSREFSQGGHGGLGGDTRRTDRGGAGDGEHTGGGGGGGGGGLYCGDGGGAGYGDNGGGGGGGGSGASDIIASAIGVVESHQEPVVGYVKVYPDKSTVDSSVASSAFKYVFLRMDGTGVTQQNPTGGVVNCQYTGKGHYEHFIVRPQPDGTVAIESEQFPDVFLRMDGTGLSREKPMDSGVVNCQYGPGALTYFRIVAHLEGSLAIESVAFPGVFLGMDGTGVTQFLPNGGGRVYCRFGADRQEAFRMLGV